MIKKSLYITGLIGILMIAGTVSLKAAETADKQAGFEKYRVIVQRNIFSRDRRPERPEQIDRPRPTRSVVLSLYILRGTVNNAGQYTAFIEEQVSGDSLKLKVGSEFFGGTIKEIRYGQVLFEKNGVTKSVRIGEEFGKQETTRIVSEDEMEQEAAASSKPAETTSESSGSDEDILKKLLERRKSQLSD